MPIIFLSSSIYCKKKIQMQNKEIEFQGNKFWTTREFKKKSDILSTIPKKEIL